MPKAGSKLRVFFAFQPGRGQCDALVKCVAPLVAQLEGQAVPAENLHATLCFIGSVALEHLDALKAAAARQRGAPLKLRFDTLDFWRKPRVLCVTAPETAASTTAQALATRLAEATRAAGFAPDPKPFRPHLTLARKIHPRRASQREWPQPLEPSLTVRCDRFVLMESRRGESGSIYSVVDSWPLDEADPS